MTPIERPISALTVTSEPLDDPGPLINLLNDESPLLWLRGGDGMVGIGVAARWEFHGVSRFADAAATWSGVAEAAVVSDRVGRPGSGLVAFGTFAFSDDSAQSSILVVPSIVIGRRDGRAWITRVNTDDPAPAPQPLPVPQRTLAALEPGRLPAASYLEAVSAAVTRIRHDELSKVVLARDLIGVLESDADVRCAIAALADDYPDCWTFSVDGFLGASPETLVSVSQGAVSARVLAGSAARGTDDASDAAASIALSASRKDQDEHEYAVRSVLSAIAPHSRDVVASADPFTLKLPNLWHLASDIEGTLDDGANSLDLIAELHPTAAVAGTPTESAVRTIAALEPFDRGRYAGPVGWVGANGDGEWAIALRCAQVASDRTVTAWAGAGIVADSNAQHELSETELKFRPIVDAFCRVSHRVSDAAAAPR